MKCDTCMHKAEEGYMNHRCLGCKYAYLPTHEAFEKKADLYEEKAISSVKTIEECCEMIKLQGKLISKSLEDDEQCYVTTLNQIADRILELYKEQISVNRRTVVQNYDAKDIINSFFNRSNSNE